VFKRCPSIAYSVLPGLESELVFGAPVVGVLLGEPGGRGFVYRRRLFR